MTTSYCTQQRPKINIHNDSIDGSSFLIRCITLCFEINTYYFNPYSINSRRVPGIILFFFIHRRQAFIIKICCLLQYQKPPHKHLAFFQIKVQKCTRLLINFMSVNDKRFDLTMRNHYFFICTGRLNKICSKYKNIRN